MKTHVAALVLLVAGATTARDEFRYVPNEAFGLGERLEYRVGYKFITAGRAYFQIAPEPVQHEGRRATTSTSKCAPSKRSTGSTVCAIATARFWTLRAFSPGNSSSTFAKEISSSDFHARFDQRNRKAITTEGTFDVPPYVHDIVSAFYYVRTLNLGAYSKGSIIQLQNFFDRQTHDLGVRILGRQTIEVEAGRFRCIVIEPLIKEGGLFKSEGRILIWLSDDERKIPVKVSTRIPIGHN